MIDYAADLNDEQRRVVLEGEGPLLVLAGAGSGKTRTLTYRVARLLDTGAPPHRILLATFTNKAARSMLQRVHALACRDLSGLWGGTFHHLAHRTLRIHAGLLGFDRRFTIADSEDARQIIHACRNDAGLGDKEDGFPKAPVLADIFSLASNTLSSLEDTVERRYPYFSHCLEGILEVARRYRERKRSLQVMDFDDLLLSWRALLRDCPDLCAQYGERFLHILVDEYQDTNALQAEIIDRLAATHRNLMVVGDDSQSIYAFRGANFSNILHFPERYPDCRVFKLETNYRSTPEILLLANLSIQNNRRQFEKSLRAVRPEGFRPVLVPARNAGQQALFVTRQIEALLGEGVCPGEIAVLYRAHFHSMELQMELTRRRLPFEVRSGIRFFEQAHIKDLLAYLRVLLNPRDEVSWMRILGLYRKIGKVTAGRVWTFVAQAADPETAVLGEDFVTCGGRAAVPGLSRLQTLLRSLRDHSQAGIPALIDLVLEEGYREILRARFDDAGSREDDMEQLAAFSASYRDLASFLSEMALLTGAGEAGTEREGEERAGRVVLSTIHQAKGLEWAVVFLVGCSEGLLPLARALKEPEGEEEERRLFYVAMTRAKDQLYLCYPVTEAGRGWGLQPLSPSRFIQEVAETRGRRHHPFDQWSLEP